MRERLTQPIARLRTLPLLVVMGFLVLTAGAGPIRAAASDSETTCPIDHSDPEQTVTALIACNQTQLDNLYRSLPAGPMPAYGSEARGYWRWSPNFAGPPAESPLNRLLELAIWQGKIFYTGKNGGYLQNRVFADEPAVPAGVYYGQGYLDGGRAIIVDYKAAGDTFMGLWFRDEIRQVQPGIYLGFGWKPRGADAENQAVSDALWAWSTAQAPNPASCLSSLSSLSTSTQPCDQNRVTFVLDFVHPEIPFMDCPQCSVVHALPTPSPTPGDANA